MHASVIIESEDKRKCTHFATTLIVIIIWFDVCINMNKQTYRNLKFTPTTVQYNPQQFLIHQQFT